MLSPLEILNRQALLLNSVAIPRVPCLSQRPWSRDFVFAGCVWAASAGVGGGNTLLAGAGSEQSPLMFVVPLSSPTTFFYFSSFFFNSKGLCVFWSCQDVFMFCHVFKEINVNEQKMLEEHVTCSQGDKNRLS